MNDASLPDPLLDLDAYLRRVAYNGSLRPSRASLEGLHLAHATHIPFENLDILLGRPIELSLERVQAKLVADRRGGYCFEQNLLFDAVLTRLGFSVRRLAARVRLGTERVLPRTHMLLLVEAEDEPRLCDVGFGAEGLLLPLMLDGAHETRQFAWSYRLVTDGVLRTLQSRRDQAAWRDLYAFTLEPQERVDYEVANHYVSTHPASRFVQTLTAQRATPAARHTLRDFELEIDSGRSVERRTIEGEAERLAVLAEVFGLQFPPGTQFRTRTAGR